jgi:hypothetical protein
MKYLTLGTLCFLPAFISGLISISTGSSVLSWLIFIASLSGIVATFVSESRYKKMMVNLPKEYTPVLGSLNAELIEYAEHLGKTIPNPDETIEIAKGYDQISNASANTVKHSVEVTGNDTPVNNTGEQSNFCRKCGTQLRSNSEFCHKCGTKIIK